MVVYKNIPFQSYSWVLGTTSFRVAQMNLRIEQLLILLKRLEKSTADAGQKWQWAGNKELQKQYYDLLQREGEVTGDATLPDKDARQKTSGLFNLGLVNDNRQITPAGQELLEHAEEGDFQDDNDFMISADSFVYLKQLLKATLSITPTKPVRPYFILAHLLNRFDYLSFEEFEAIMPLIIDNASLKLLEGKLESLRQGKTTIDDVVFEVIMTKDNYKDAHTLWMENSVDLPLIQTVGFNRKSRGFDQPYLDVYTQLKRVFIEGGQSTENVLDLFRRIDSISGGSSQLWRTRIFGKATKRKVATEGAAAFSPSNPFSDVGSEHELKELFFKYLHLHKVRVNLRDYFDQNRRYFKLTDTILFKDGEVRFDTIPKAFFSLVGESLVDEMFTKSSDLEKSVPLADISANFDISQDTLLRALSTEYGVELTSLGVARDFVDQERYHRLHELLDTRFTSPIMAELLDCFQKRNDKRIAEIVTRDATPSTIFEYILALVFYEFSGRSGRVLDFMKLTLEADLMPRTHAQGGDADVIFEFEESNTYPAHSMLIEATLASGTNARKMEMEPVSRHLGTHIFDSGNEMDYCVFVAPEIDPNIANDFRFRKDSGFWDQDGENSVPLKIIPINIEQVRKLVERKVSYSDLYDKFDTVYQSKEMRPIPWQREIESLLFPESFSKLPAGTSPHPAIATVERKKERRSL